MDKRGSINRPPVLDGSNYDYWKARMVAFLKSMDQKAWRAIITGWNHPIITAADGSTSLKGVAEWSPEEETEASGNSKALNAIFNGVDENMFKLINTCTEAKQAWEILQTAHEGTSKVRMSKLQLLATKFENLRMEDEETISEFNTRIRDIANSTFALGEKIPEEKLARKILRSLPKRFNMKVTAIEESQDLSTMKVDELIGSLQTFEMSLDDKPEKKMKNLAFKSEESQTDDELSEALAYLTKNFNKSLSQLQARYKPNVPDKRSNIKSQGKTNEENISEQNKEVRCFNVKDLDTSDQNVQTFSGNRKREWQLLYLILRKRRKKNQQIKPLLEHLKLAAASVMKISYKKNWMRNTTISPLNGNNLVNF